MTDKFKPTTEAFSHSPVAAPAAALNRALGGVKHLRKLPVFAMLSGLAGCGSHEPVLAERGEAPETFVNYDTIPFTNSSKVRLPASVRIASDEAPNFGIEVSNLAPEEAAVVTSAWQSYQIVLAGGVPTCALAYGVSDGGTATYFCGGFNITRVHGFSSNGGISGYKYGPMLDLLNGQRVQKLRFYSDEQMAELEKAAP